MLTQSYDALEVNPNTPATAAGSFAPSRLPEHSYLQHSQIKDSCYEQAKAS
jgi:hypothetical protein